MQRLERLIGMIDLINRGRCPGVEEMCRRFGVDKRTIYEDIKWLKVRGKFSLKHDRTKGGYINTDPTKSLPSFDFSDEEFFALALSKKLTIKNTGGALEAPLDSVISNISKRRNDGQSQLEPDVDVGFRTAALLNPFLFDVFNALRTGKDECRTVRMQYYSANTDEVTTRKLDPHFIYERTGSWYVIGFCHLRKQIRNFALHRIQSCKVTKDTFTAPPASELATWVSSSSQVEIRGPEINVCIQFEPRTARFVREKQWHKKQRVTALKDGGIQIEFPTRSLEEVKRWLMSYGSGGRAISPPELRQLVINELRSSIKIYENTTEQET